MKTRDQHGAEIGATPTETRTLGPKVSIVVPVYNSQSTLHRLVQRLSTVLQPSCEDYEIILVDDGSHDASWSSIQSLASSNPHVRGVALSRNYGQHNALLAGILLADHEVIVTLDDDLQHPPEEIPHLLAALDPTVDVVYGVPRAGMQVWWRNVAARATKEVLRRSMGVENATKVSAFRAFRRDLRQAFEDLRDPYPSIDILLSWGTTRFRAIEVQHEARNEGSSQYSVRKLVLHALNMITGFTVLPLQIASAMGIAFSLFGGLVLCYVLVVFLIHGRSVPGFAFLASIIALFSGSQLLALGIIGEYLARIHFRSMNKPAFMVRSTTTDPEKRTDE